jgi:hypothetical protein
MKTDFYEPSVLISAADSFTICRSPFIVRHSCSPKVFHNNTSSLLNRDAASSSSVSTDHKPTQAMSIMAMAMSEQSESQEQKPIEITPAARHKDMPMPDNVVDADSVYEFYKDNLFPAIRASLPVLFSRLGHDLYGHLQVGSQKVARFLLPGYRNGVWHAPQIPNLPNILQLMEQAASNSTIHDFMIRNFDTNHDGHISRAELLNMTEILAASGAYPQTWFQFLSTSWPLMDWKVGVFLWRSCGGLLLLIALMSLLPGRMHGILSKLLRWPVLGLTYFIIAVELSVYIVIRLFIRIIETTFANSKHRKLRHLMRHAKSYKEWYEYASGLDISQGRHLWRQQIHQETSCRYNWSFIKELISDLRKARATKDSLMALAVLQQCTRKNVGGIMSEESFSFTNTGEPKFIVKEFVEEVAITLRWVTSRCLMEEDRDVAVNEEEYDMKLQTKVRQEKKKIWGSVVAWATLNFETGTNEDKFEIPANSRHDPRKVSEREIPASAPASPGTLSNDDSDRELNNLPAFHKEKTIAFLKRCRAAYGRTALCLSGGAMMGLYHFGIVKALLELGILPNIISGTSAGSVIGAIICTRTHEEIQRDLDPAILSQKLKCFHLAWSERAKNLRSKGCMFNYEDWREMIRWFTNGDMTFAEAFKKTGRVFCITLCEYYASLYLAVCMLV